MSKKLAGAIALVSISIAAYFILPTTTQKSQPVADTNEASIADSIPPAPPEPTILYGMVIDSMVVIEDKIKRNQNISEILSSYNIPYQDIHQLAKASKDVFDVRRIAANKKYTLICDPDSLNTAKALIYEPNAIEYVVFNLSDSISVEKKQREIQIVEREISGVIQSSLSVTMEELGVSHALTNDLVDVFAWQIDFYRLQKGDRFKVIYEEKSVGGEVVGIGDIKAAQFEHFKNDFFAIPFTQDEKFEYYDEEGKSLRKALLKYPLEFSRISSRYSLKRFHPVQKRYKAHLGTDFAAPTGTPIRSVGDGIVLEARYSKYNGNYVKIKHNGTYTTQYLHMSKIASGIKPGVKVKQGQTIGKVGSTGLATGAHLCYRFWKNGVQVDALRVKLPSSAPIQEENKEAFDILKDSLIKSLEKIAYPETVEPEMIVRAE
ncbi:MAG: peptidoglycan DD-metalloendopeptidase family protein [Bacteroidota bacterium]